MQSFLGQFLSNAFNLILVMVVCTVLLLPILEILKRRSGLRAIFSTKSKAANKQKAIRIYAVKLGHILKSRYGDREQYTPKQVRTMVQEWGYDSTFQCYALAMYCNLMDFDDYHRLIGEQCDYDAMRTEVTQCLNSSHESFPDNNNFGTFDLLQFSNDFQSSYGNNIDSSFTCVDGGSGGYDGGSSCDTGSSYDGGGGSCDGGSY
jgi:uncharacterized membrane protein YgcG